jgi:hypothetical protein
MCENTCTHNNLTQPVKEHTHAHRLCDSVETLNTVCERETRVHTTLRAIQMWLHGDNVNAIAAGAVVTATAWLYKTPSVQERRVLRLRTSQH